MKKHARKLIRFLSLLFITSILSFPDHTFAGNADNFIFTGAAVSSYEIEIPPGRKGMAPKLNLTYKSMQKNGWVGLGWDLSMGYIGINPKYGVPSYDFYSKYVLVLNGSTHELTPIPDGNYDGYYHVDEYRLKLESLFLKIKKETNGWSVWDKSGTKYTFGLSSSTRMEQNGNVFKWYLERAEDLNGNFFSISYTAPDPGQVYLDQIDYTGHTSGESPKFSVKFVREARTDVSTSYMTGWKVVTAQRLASIEISCTAVNGGDPFKKYLFQYSESPVSKRSRLSAIEKQYYKNSSWVSFPAKSTFKYASDEVDFVIKDYTPPLQPSGLPSWSQQLTGVFQPLIKIVDMNQDALPDVLFAYKDNWQYLPNIDGTSFGDPIQLTGTPSEGFEDSRTKVVDLDEDGLADILFKPTDADSKWGIGYYKNNGNGSFTYLSGIKIHPQFPNGMLIDLNGDGRQDSLNSPYSAWQYIKAGSSPYNPIFELTNHPPVDVDDEDLRFNDINGDGLVDVVWTDESDIVKYWANQGCIPGTGCDFYADPVILTMPSGAPNTKDKSTNLIDINGDGLADLLWAKENDYAYWPNMGNEAFGDKIDLTNDPDFDWDNEASSKEYDNWAWWDRFTITDLDGDGMLDFINGSIFTGRFRFVDGVFSVDTQYWSLQPKDQVHPHLLIESSNGLGATSTIQYTPSTKYDNTGGDGIPDLGQALQLVSSITLSDGLGNSYTTKYDYWGGVFDQENLEFLGFQRVKTTLPDGKSTTTYFHQDDVWKGNAYSVESYDANGFKWMNVTSIWEQKPVYGLVDSGEDGIFPYLRNTFTYTYDKDGNESWSNKEFTYDEDLSSPYEGHGNIETTTETTSDGLKRVTTSLFNVDTSLWLFVPQRTYVEDRDGTIFRDKQFVEYDTRGNLKQVNTWLEGATFLETKMDYYDIYGNVERVTDAENHWTETEYDITFHQYPVQTTQQNDNGNLISQITYYGVEGQAADDGLVGQSKKSIDTNNNAETLNKYDLFGRPIESYIPDSSGQATILSKTIDYVLYSGPDSPNQVHSTSYVGDGTTLESYVFTDGLGRRLETKSTGKQGELIGISTKYDEVGRVKKITLPYSTNPSYDKNAAKNKGTTKIYDPLNRVIEVQLPDGTRGKTDYSFNPLGQGMVTSMDANYNEGNTWRQKKATVTDGFGRTVEVWEYDGGSLYATTTYVYNIVDDLEYVYDNDNNETHMTYYMNGWKKTMDDPDKGSITYEYDGVGNLLFQTDNKTQQIEFQYDTLNRLEKKITSDGITTDYTYDEYAFGYFQSGRLTTVSTPDLTTRFYYDSMGRSQVTEKIIDGDIYTSTMTYDNLGRQKTITYPTIQGKSEIVTNTYTGNYLQTMTGDNGQEYVTDMEYNTNGQVIKKTLGNGVTTDYTYYPYNFRLQSLTSLNANSRTLQKLYYGYDYVGNIKMIDDYAPGRANNQSYIYDDLYRLKEYFLDAVSTRSYDYDELGNIIYKSNVGSYTYDMVGNAGPHAVTNAGGVSYAYDLNGNMISGNGRTLDYNPEDRLIEAIAKGTIARYQYDQDGTRIRKTVQIPIDGLMETTSLTKETVYLGDLCEIEKVDTNIVKITRHYFADSQRVASREIVDNTEKLLFYHGDHIGSSNIVTDETGNEVQRLEYFPFGEIRRNEQINLNNDPNHVPVDVAYKFTGKQLDQETELYYYGARYYDPYLGRFITGDDIVQNFFNPQSLNRYSYVTNNPVIMIDPTGEFGFIAAMVVGAIIGGAFAAINGGNILQGMFIGAFSGAVGGFVGQAVAQATNVLVGGIVGGYIGGSVSAALYLGDPGKGGLWGALGGFMGAGGGVFGHQIGGKVGGIIGSSIGVAASASIAGGNFMEALTMSIVAAGLVYAFDDVLTQKENEAFKATSDATKANEELFRRHVKNAAGFELDDAKMSRIMFDEIIGERSGNAISIRGDEGTKLAELIQADIYNTSLFSGTGLRRRIGMHWPPWRLLRYGKYHPVIKGDGFLGIWGKKYVSVHMDIYSPRTHYPQHLYHDLWKRDLSLEKWRGLSGR